MTIAGDRQETGAPMLKIDKTYGGVYAGTSFEFSSEVVDHFNGAAESAGEVLDGEYVPFTPGEYVSVACPMAASYPRDAFVAAYQELRVRLDDDLEVRLAEHPRLFSNDPRDPTLIRAVPTYIRKDYFPEGFFGQSRTLELFQGEELIFGPAERFFHTRSSGLVFDHIENGVRRVVVEIVGALETLEHSAGVIFFTDPVFGAPTGAAQVFDDGSTVPLPYRILGKDYVGDRCLFNEGLVPGVRPADSRVVVELYVPQPGVGLAAALYAGHTRDLAFRSDAEVLG